VIGDWIAYDTTVKEVCAVVERVYFKKDLKGFKGDRAFVESDYAMKMYSKLRSSGAGLYNWRAINAKTAEEKQRMTQEADFAFRQAFALFPVSPEAVFRYVQLLTQSERIDDALLITRTAMKLDPKNEQIRAAVTELLHMKRQAKGAGPKE